MQPYIPLVLAIYIIFYSFEGLIRYGFYLVGADYLIFIRDAADNIFVLMYAYFGVMTFVYLGAVMVAAVKVKDDNEINTKQAMATLFMGAALACICEKIKNSRQNTPLPVIMNGNTNA